MFHDYSDCNGVGNRVWGAYTLQDNIYAATLTTINTAMEQWEGGVI